MAESMDHLEMTISEATSSGFRAKLLQRGEARSMIWRDGTLPVGAPDFDPMLTYDLLSYGYSLLNLSIRLLENNGDRAIAQRGFESAATAIESVIRNGPDIPDRTFHRVAAAAGHHLGGFAARAYSTLTSLLDSSDITTSEKCLVYLMRRDLDELSNHIANYRNEDAASDDGLVLKLHSLYVASGKDYLPEDNEDIIAVAGLAIEDTFVGAMSAALLAFERGDEGLLSSAIQTLHTGLEAAGELNFVHHWWCHRLAIFLLDGLWESSFHQVLPQRPPDQSMEQWESLRAIFIASLFCRKRAEIELWPSQIEAARRAANVDESIVLSLPTSAGKTRIAEIAALATLSAGQKVVVITPLRALSAQTEATLARTFGPVGKSVTSLYGAIGTTVLDQSLIRQRDITVATPEKFDFALRNDPSLLDDVGLVVFDEGHMIGFGQREVRYEVQVQRLLRRSDAANRRIVCLSAVLPQAGGAEDFVDWVTQEQPDGLIANEWRPTKLRYGEVTLRGNYGRLNISVGDETPFVPHFIESLTPPVGQRKAKFPRNQQELVLATAWRLVDEGQTVLIYCPLKKSVTSLARVIVDLYKRDALRDVYEGDRNELNTAQKIGQEWFAPDHPILRCLEIGVAVHHGSLPGPFRREIERLLRQGILKITVSSSTLAQGLNLSASALVIHSLWRSGELIEPAEFHNVVGRAGRAFTDSVGLVIHPMFENTSRNRRHWTNFVKGSSQRALESGLLQVVMSLLRKLWAKLGTSDLERLTDYITGQAAWTNPDSSKDAKKETDTEIADWNWQLASLDGAILSMMDSAEETEHEIEEALDAALASSLWNRSLGRQPELIQTQARALLYGRANYIWNSASLAKRKACYLAGVGLKTGDKLEEHAPVLELLLRETEGAIVVGEEEIAITAITKFAEIAFEIDPFIPTPLPSRWKDVLTVWLRGEALSQLKDEDPGETLDFVERGLSYSLIWAIESVRVRALAYKESDKNDDIRLLSDTGIIVDAIETGTLHRSAAMLMKAGFASRSGAIAAVEDTGATFQSSFELELWLNSFSVQQKSTEPTWPTSSSHELWDRFLTQRATARVRTWQHELVRGSVTWEEGYSPLDAAPYRAVSTSAGETSLEDASGHTVGKLDVKLNPSREGMLTVTGSTNSRDVQLNYVGPSDLYN